MEYIFRNLACFCIFFLLLSPIISFYLHNLEISQIIIKKPLLLHDLRFFSNVFWCRCSFKANHWISQTFHCSNLYLDSPLNHLSYISSLPSSPLNLLSAEFIKSIPFFHIHYLFIEGFFFSSSPFLHTQLSVSYWPQPHKHYSLLWVKKSYWFPCFPTGSVALPS